MNQKAPDSETLHAVVPAEAAGRRFDAVLAELFPDYSRSRLAGEPADVMIAPRLGHMGLLDYHRGAGAIVVPWRPPLGPQPDRGPPVLWAPCPRAGWWSSRTRR